MQNVIFVTAILHLKCYYVSEIDMKLNTNKKEKEMKKNFDGAQTASEWEAQKNNHKNDVSTRKPYEPEPGSELEHTLSVIRKTHEADPDYCHKCGYMRNEFNDAHDENGNCRYTKIN